MLFTAICLQLIIYTGQYTDRKNEQYYTAHKWQLKLFNYFERLRGTAYNAF